MQLNLHRAGSGPPLVLIHGIGSRWQIWNPVLPLLEGEREVVAIDLPGFGDSPMPAPGTPPGIPSLARLVGEFLDEIGLERPHVAGNSLGGWIALELAKRGRVSSVTGLSPGGFGNDREVAFTRASLRLMVRASRDSRPALSRSPGQRSGVRSRSGRRPLTRREFHQRTPSSTPAASRSRHGSTRR